MYLFAFARRLDDQAVDLVFHPTLTGGNVFIGSMPDKPDTAVMLQPTGGLEQPDLDPSETPTFQVLLRAPAGAQRAGYELAKQIRDALHGLDHLVLDQGGPDEVFVIGTTALQGAPVGIGVDPVQRPEWSLNFAAQLSAPTSLRPAH